MTIFRFVLAQRDACRFKNETTAARYAKLPLHEPTVSELPPHSPHLRGHQEALEWCAEHGLSFLRPVLVQEAVRWAQAERGRNFAIEEAVALEFVRAHEAERFHAEFPNLTILCQIGAAA